MAQTKVGRHNRGSTLTEMFKLAGDIVEDGVNLMIGSKMDDESFDSINSRRWGQDESSEETGGEGYRALRKEYQKNEKYDADSYATTASEEIRQDRIRQIRQREMDNYRRHRDVGDERELELKQKLSQFSEDFLANGENTDEDPDFIYHGPSTRKNTNSPEEEEEEEKVFTKNIFERAEQIAVARALSLKYAVSREEETTVTDGGDTNSTDDTEDSEDEEDDFADQIVHEMMQLLHHSRKNRNEAERLIEYKRAFIRQRHETNPELDAHILKNANYKKLECSTRRFIRNLDDGDVPRTEETLGMEKELLQNIAAMRDIRRESDELDMEFEMMFDAAE